MEVPRPVLGIGNGRMSQLEKQGPPPGDRREERSLQEGAPLNIPRSGRELIPRRHP